MRVLDAAGALVAAGAGALTTLRAGKPMHPVGAVLRGRVVRTGSTTGITWFDGTGDDEVLVRLSRAVGLPPGWPDVHGLAVRSGGADLLLSTTGRAVGLRHLLSFRRHVGGGCYSCLVPFRTERGPVMVAALPSPRRELPSDPAELAAALADDPWVLDLVWAPLGGAWRRFGTLVVAGPARTALDPPVRFEPLAPPAGLDVPAWVARVRVPAYRTARRVHPTPDAPPPPATAPTGVAAVGP